jgi:predicted Zn-dependent protease
MIRRIAPLLAITMAATACAISQQQEVEMGAQYATQIDTQLPLMKDAQVNGFINTLGQQLAAVSDSRGLAWHFAVVDSKEVNAFAVPGGWVYINRGLISRAATMDELAGVIGHEIGHITLRHTVQQMQQSQKVGGGLMALCTLTKVCDSKGGQAAIDLGGTALFASFSRQDEAQADDEGVRTSVKARIDPQGLPKMFRILLAERQTNPGAVDAFFATHPLAEDRIAATTKQIASYPPAEVRGLTVDTEAFRSLKRRLAALPPSPAPRK